MRASVIGMGFLALAAGLQAQPLDLSGRIVNGNGTAIPDAVVELRTRGSSARTAADGSFRLGGQASLEPGGARRTGYRLDPPFLVVDARFPLDLTLEVFDGTGGLQGSCARRLGTGRHDLALSEVLPGSGGKPGLYFLRLHLDGHRSIHPFILPGGQSRGSIFAPAYRGGAAAKGAAAVDSLRVRKAGYQDLVLAVASYTAGALGDLILSESPDDGSICARQSRRTTSDGFEVVFCEALFDRAPRVRLPAPAAASVYAAMTAEAFVTGTGEAYPHTLRQISGPEVDRHASALYEVKLRDGKWEAFRPAILFAESLFMAPLMGKAFEGRISKRTAADRYELEPSLPVRVQIEDVQHQGKQGGRIRFPGQGDLGQSRLGRRLGGRELHAGPIQRGPPSPLRGRLGGPPHGRAGAVHACLRER